MSEVIEKDLVQERIDKYIEDNQADIIEQIDKKIATKVKEAINDVFRIDNSWKKTEAAKIVEGKIEHVITVQSQSIDIDSDWIRDQVSKKVKSTVKNLKVTI